MKSNDLIICIALICGLFIASSTQAQQQRKSRKGPFIENDTTFLYRFSANDNEYNCFIDAYIEKNHQSEAFQRVIKQASTYCIYDHDKVYYDGSLKRLKEKYQQPLPKHSLPNIPRTWIPLSSFQGKYYLNELESPYVVWFTDSICVHNTMEGPEPYVIKSFKKISPTHYQFSLFHTDYPKNIDLYIIDQKRKIAVFVETTPNQSEDYKRYRLYVAKETLPQLDLIAWDSTDEPGYDDVDFDKIDFQKLISTP